MHIAVPHVVYLAARSLDAHFQVSARRLDNAHEVAVLEMRHAALKDLLAGSLKKVDVLHQQCSRTLEIFAEQATTYLRQLDQITTTLINADLRDEKINALQRRQCEIDGRLAEIRADSQLLFTRMGLLITQLDRIGVHYPAALSLPPALRSRD
jgi:hypothetical protein